MEDISVEWQEDSYGGATWQPKPGVKVRVLFEDNRYSGDEYEPVEEVDCYEWRIVIFDEDGEVLFREDSGGYLYGDAHYMPRYMPLKECKEEAINFYRTRLAASLANDRGEAKKEFENLSAALEILNQEEVVIF